jgi:hypothetical protein
MVPRLTPSVLTRAPVAVDTLDALLTITHALKEGYLLRVGFSWAWSGLILNEHTGSSRHFDTDYETAIRFVELVGLHSALFSAQKAFMGEGAKSPIFQTPAPIPSLRPELTSLRMA